MSTDRSFMKKIEGVAPLGKQRIADAIERHQISSRKDKKFHEEASIVRAADFIGQLGDPQLH
jgi:hypothetical protein